MQKTKKPYEIHLILSPGIAGLLTVLEALKKREETSPEGMQAIKKQEIAAPSMQDAPEYTIML